MEKGAFSRFIVGVAGSFIHELYVITTGTVQNGAVQVNIVDTKIHSIAEIDS